MLPSNSPFIIQKLICTTCGEVMRVMIEKQANGKPVNFNYFCDSKQCLYGFTSQTYSVGVNIPHDGMTIAKALFNYEEVPAPKIEPSAKGPVAPPAGGPVPVKTPTPVPADPSTNGGIQAQEQTSTNGAVTEPKASETQGAQ